MVVDVLVFIAELNLNELLSWMKLKSFLESLTLKKNVKFNLIWYPSN